MRVQQGFVGAALVLLAIVGASAHARVPAPQSRPGTVTREVSTLRGDPAALEILDRVRSVYRSCRSYRDTGELASTLNLTGPQGQSASMTTQVAFNTSFRRPASFCFRVPSYQGPFGPKSAALVWLEGNESRTWLSGRTLPPPRNFADALAAGMGASDFAISIITPLLLPDRCGGALGPFALTSASLIEDAELDGRRCRRIAGLWNGAQTRVYWIDAESSLIRKVETQSNPVGRQKTIVTLDPVIDGDVPDAALAFDPETLQASLGESGPASRPAAIQHSGPAGPWDSNGQAAPSGDPAAAALLVSMLDSYRAANTYVDFGRSVEKVEGAAMPAETITDFSIAYRKGGGCLFRCFTPQRLGHPSGGLAWGSNGSGKSYSPMWGTHPQASLDAALNALIYESGGSSAIMDAFVATPIPAEVLVRNSFRNPSMLEAQVIDGVKCRGVRAVHNEFAELQFWIDDANLLRRLDERVNLGGLRTTTTTSFHPVLNGPVSDGALEFNEDQIKEAIRTGRLPGASAP